MKALGGKETKSRVQAYIHARAKVIKEYKYKNQNNMKKLMT